MKIKAAWIAALCLLPASLVAQTPAVPTMDHEPHHHLALHNNYVKVFNVEVAPGDSIILHSHDQDTIAIAIGEQLVTVGIPGKTIPPSKNADGQVRLQRSGYIHSTHVDGDTPYHTVAVELMQPQTNFHNVCAEILPGQPLNCPEGSSKTTSAFKSQPLLESGETRALLVRVLAHQSIQLGESPAPQVIVTLDAASVLSGAVKGPEKTLKPGDFVWMDAETSRGSTYENPGDREARFIQIIFPGGK
jgi:quercetin dioxygenase-like cupin family protein